MRNPPIAAPLLFALLISGVDVHPATAAGTPDAWTPEQASRPSVRPRNEPVNPSLKESPKKSSGITVNTQIKTQIQAQIQAQSQDPPTLWPPRFSTVVERAVVEREEPEPPAELLAQLPRSLTPAPIEATSLSPVAQAEPGRTIPTPRPDFFPPEQPLPTEPLPQLPPAEELLPSPSVPNIPGDLSGDADTKIEVTGYRIEGSTVFDEAELAAVTAPYVGSITFAQLLQARSAVTQLYVNKGYATSGAFIPPQTLTDGKVTIQVLEGTLEEIKVVGTNHLKPFYVRDRIALAGAKPLNVNQLLEGLKLLQLDPLLRSVSADLQAGIQPGTSALEVTVAEADPFTTRLTLDNERSPSVGTFRRKVQFDHRNLIGIGDSLGLAYSNTDGSNGMDVFYAVPFNATNGTVRFSYGRARSNVVEKPFSNLDISSKSTYYELNIRQPVERTPTRDIALGLAFSRQESQTRLGFADIGPFPLSPGASERGETRVSALRFFQEWSDRNSKQVLAARSQFSLGVPWFEATDNTAVSDEVPDSEFFAWRTQAQWVRLLAPDALLLIRGDVQLSDRALLPLEQFGMGGAGNGRGYRQDTILSDSGFQVTSEVRLPLARFPKRKGLVQVIPFLDWGRGWNNTFPQPDTKTLLSTGLGLLWQQGNNFSARLDWGYPLINRPENRDNWQENGLYFSVEYTPF